MRRLSDAEIAERLAAVRAELAEVRARLAVVPEDSDEWARLARHRRTLMNRIWQYTHRETYREMVRRAVQQQRVRKRHGQAYYSALGATETLVDALNEWFAQADPEDTLYEQVRDLRRAMVARLDGLRRGQGGKRPDRARPEPTVSVALPSKLTPPTQRCPRCGSAMRVSREDAEELVCTSLLCGKRVYVRATRAARR